MNPVICRLWRGSAVEAEHRGVWVLVDSAGEVLGGRGDPEQLVFARSATKPIQAIPFVESGCASAIAATQEDLAVAMASHSGEAIHVNAVSSLLMRGGVEAGDLKCGPQLPRRAEAGAVARSVTNNCSGKHAAFLATARHLGDHVGAYLDRDSAIQQAVHETMLDMTRLAPELLEVAIDGCSAPTFRMPLRALATAMAQFVDPTGLVGSRADACRQLYVAAGAHPELMGGTSGRIDTDITRVTDGRVVAKGGAEGVIVAGLSESGCGLAIKVDDGNERGYSRLVVELLGRLGALRESERVQLDHWGTDVRKNSAGVVVGRVETPDDVLP